MYGECMYSSVLFPRPSLYRYRVLPPKSNPRLDIGTGTFPHRIFASSCSSSPPPSTHHFPSWSWIIISLFFSVGVVFFFVSFSFSCFIFSAFFPFIFWLLFLLIFPCSCSPRVFGLGRWINVTCSLPSAVSLRLSPSLSLFFFPLLPFPSPSIFLPLFFFLLEISLKFYHDSAQSSTSHPVGELWISSTSFSSISLFSFSLIRLQSVIFPPPLPLPWFVLPPTDTYLPTYILPISAYLPYWKQYWRFSGGGSGCVCKLLAILCPHRLVPLALFGLTEPSDPLRFVRPQPKARLSLSTIHFPPLPPPTPHPSFGSSVHPKSNHPNNCSTELYSLRPKRFFIPRLFSLYFLSLFPPSRYRLNRTTLLLPFHIPLNSIALPTTSYRLPSSPQISRDVTE